MTKTCRSEVSFTICLPKPFGRLMVAYLYSRVTRVRHLTDDRAEEAHEPMDGAKRDTHLERKLCEDLTAYFSGRKVVFDYDLDVDRFTAFQKDVWAAMREIPYGETRSYLWIAEKIGKPRACRAVGNACGKNPLLILQPCHRVVGSGGKLGGFSAGLELKKALLQLEGVDVETLSVNKTAFRQSIK
jgi:methylated-DNA-[protein]-cysteine S-methyltransferase